MALGYILWSFGNLVVLWYIFFHFGMLGPRKSGNPATDVRHPLHAKPMGVS
jgi:hypothetical protein